MEPYAHVKTRLVQGVAVPAALVFVVAIAVYVNSLFHGFVYDDAGQVVRNPWIRDIRFLPDIFRKAAWSFLPGQSTSNFYRPMMHLIYLLTYHIFGLKPWGFHLVNVLLHAGNSVLVFLVISKMPIESAVNSPSSEEVRRRHTSDSGATPAYFVLSSPCSFLAFFAALLFAAHPLHTEAVAWVAGLPGVSCTFFFLFSFYLYIRSGDGGKISYALSLAAFFAATLCKEPALTLPIVLIAYDTVFATGRGSGAKWVRWLPYFVICGIYLFLRVQALKGLTAYVAFPGLTPSQYIINVLPLFSEYLKDLLLPINLRFWHSFHPLHTLFGFEGLSSLAVATFVAVAALLASKKDRLVFMGLVLLVVPLLPFFYIKGIFGKPYAERYAYLPSAGFSLLLALLVLRLRQALASRGQVTVILALLLTTLFSLQTAQRNSVWESDLTLFADAVAKAPEAALPRRELATALLNAGRADEALVQYRIAMRLDPNSAILYKNMALAFMKKALHAEALSSFKKAVSLAPGDIDARRGLAEAYAASGLKDEAIREYRTILESNPNSPEVHTGLGLVLAKKGDNEGAAQHYRKAIAADPDYAAAHCNLGSLYANSGRIKEAIAHFRTAVRLEPDNAFFRNVLGIAYGTMGDAAAAEAEFEAAVRLAPEEDAYRHNLEKAAALTRIPAGNER